MKSTLTTLAATVLALTLAAHAHAGHHMSHPNTQPTQQHNNVFVGNNGHTNNIHTNFVQQHDQSNKGGKMIVHTSRHDHLRASDCCYFNYRCWCPRCSTYIFYYPSDCCWYYWCADRGCYLPYDQITIYPPQANVVPQIPGGLPPAVPGDDGNGLTADQDQDQDGTPPMPPADVKGSVPTTLKTTTTGNPFNQ